MRKYSIRWFFKNSYFYIKLFFLLTQLFYQNILFWLKLKPSIKICISTTVGYAEKTIPILIHELEKRHISLNNVYVFEGGHTRNQYVNKGYHHYFVDHNSFDLTSLISILELNIGHKYWLLLHDTVKLKKSFSFLFRALNPYEIECLPLREYPSMNIGVYTREYLNIHEDFIRSSKNQDCSIEGLQRAKTNAIKFEDYLFKNSTKKKYIHPILGKYEKSSFEVYIESERKKEIYPQLGIIKYKANYKLQDTYSIKI